MTKQKQHALVTGEAKYEEVAFIHNTTHSN